MSSGGILSLATVLQSRAVMRRNPFGMDICCRKGSRSPLQELYNPIQGRLMDECSKLSPPCSAVTVTEDETLPGNLKKLRGPHE
ncbi:carbohydrate sulfotransferase 11 [Cricetulus griseus]|nr:carbohydrate sulfotransferase 11 [Cricetulus griseus]